MPKRCCTAAPDLISVGATIWCSHAMSRKRRKLDFAALASTSQSLLDSVDAIKECVVHLKQCIDRAFDMWSSDLGRVLNRCDVETLEFVLVSRLGLEGVDCLRHGLQVVPSSFLSEKNGIVCAIVNTVSKSTLEANECQHLGQVVHNKCSSYAQRKIDHRAYCKEMWDLTLQSGNGHNVFLGPPSSTCIKGGCSNALLQKHNNICNVTVFDMEGPLPGSKITLSCPSCRGN